MNEHRAEKGNPLYSVSHKSGDDASNVGTGQPRPGDDEGAPVLQAYALSPSPTQTKSALQPFLDGLHRLGLELTKQQLDQFVRYQQELLDWNTRINLTSITNS